MLTEHHLKCPLCKSMLKDPVSITCGHSFCRDCINAFWDNCAGDFACPHCGQASETRPVLNTNVALAEVVKNLQQTFSPALPPQSYAGPEDVACDFCTENRLKAVKFCSTCDVFLCETHIRQHYTIPALQKHTLRDVTAEDQMKMKLLLEQQKPDDITSGQQNQTDETQDLIKDEIERILESMMNNIETTCADVSRPETEINKEDPDVGNLAPNFSNLAVSAVKQSFVDVDNYEEEWEIGDFGGVEYTDEYDDVEHHFDYDGYYDDYGDDYDGDMGYDCIHGCNDWDDDY